MKKTSKYIIVEFNTSEGVFYYDISGRRTSDIDCAHKNRTGRKNIEREYEKYIADGSVRLIEKEGFFL